MKDVACFETPSDDPLLHVEFDFEKNLALFNKEEMWEKLNDKPKQDKVNKYRRINLCDNNNY